jgi:hypothetical protein
MLPSFSGDIRALNDQIRGLVDVQHRCWLLCSITKYHHALKSGLPPRQPAFHFNSGFSAAPALIVILGEREKAQNVGHSLQIREKFSKLQTEWRREWDSLNHYTAKPRKIGGSRY